MKNFKFLLTLVITSILFSCNKDEESVIQKYLGTYEVTDSCSNGTTSYEIVISVKNQGTDEIYIENFGGYEAVISAYVNGDNIQIDDYADNLHIIGTGTINNERNKINFIYTTSNNNLTDNCSSIATK